MSGPRAPLAALAAMLAVAALALRAAVAEPPPSERSALLAFLTATPHERRLGWNTSTPTCGWVGVTCDSSQSAVVEVRLPGVGIVGAIPPGTLGRLTNLRVLSLRSNRVLGSIPDDVLQLPNLKALFLQQNRLSGAIPPGIARLGGLERLVLSHNDLSGSIPFALNNLTALRVLRLDGNNLTGSIPSISIKGLNVFNVSDNNLNGSIPKSLSHFPADSFSGNRLLCGDPLPACKSAFFPPTEAPGMSPGGGGPMPGSSKKHKLSGAAIAGIVVGAVVVGLLLLIAIVLCAVSRRRRDGAREGPKAATSTAAAAAAGAAGRGQAPPASGEGGGMTSSSKEDLGGGASGSTAAVAAAAAGGAAGEHSRLVFVGKGAGYSFDLEDLLRASAEVLGKGSVGTSYKAVLEEGTTVVVKRLKDVAVARREFDAHMEALGRVEHRNVLPVRAYYFSKDEKLLVYDYLPNGSLSAMLHGQCSSSFLHTRIVVPRRRRGVAAALPCSTGISFRSPTDLRVRPGEDPETWCFQDPGPCPFINSRVGGMAECSIYQQIPCRTAREKFTVGNVPFKISNWGQRQIEYDLAPRSTASVASAAAARAAARIPALMSGRSQVSWLVGAAGSPTNSVLKNFPFP
jgi:hypothetical protein